MKIVKISCPLVNGIPNAALCHSQCIALDNTIISIKHDNQAHLLHYANDVDVQGHNLFDYDTIVNQIKTATLVPDATIQTAKTLDAKTFQAAVSVANAALQA